MISATLRAEYARQKRELARGFDSLPTFPGAALQALRIAKGAARLAALQRALNVPHYAGDSDGLELPNGARLVYKANSDDCPDFEERSGLSVDWSRRCWPDYIPEGWLDRNGATYWTGERSRDWARITSGYSLAERIKDRRRRMSRHAAYTEARRELAREFDFWRDYWHGHESWLYCSVTLYGPDGAEIASEACGGIESGGDYWREFLAETADAMLRQYVQDCGKEIETERRRINSTRATFRKLARELRALARLNSEAPNACNVLRAHLAALRARVRESVARIRADRAAVFAIWRMGVQS